MSDHLDDEDESYYSPESKKGKYDFHVSTESNNDMPEKYCHVRYGVRKVRSEIYTLSSEFHMSKAQIEGSILAVANLLFDRDSKTLPSMKNLLHTEPQFEAMALCAIADEMMMEDTIAAITYSDGGYSMCVGRFIHCAIFDYQ